MAASEVIHFPLSAQLGPRQSPPARIPPEPTNLIATDLIPPYRFPFLAPNALVFSP
jgi:hypothetical protein